MLVTLKENWKELIGHNEFLALMKIEEPEDDYWKKAKDYKSLEDFLMPYKKFIDNHSEKDKKKYFKIPEFCTNFDGIYVAEDANFDVYLEKYTDLKKSDSNRFLYFHGHGVCDNASQAILKYEELIKEQKILSSDKIVIILVPFIKEKQSKFGWRWSKWGRYIGIQNRQHEYLYDEEDIELVYYYSIELMQDSLD